MGDFSKVETDGRLMIVTINRPEVYNACHPMANQELVDAFDEFHANPDLWVAIITGAGDKAFCAGNDLKYHAEIQKKTGKRPVHPAKGFGGLANRFDLEKPVIAAVNGHAYAGGFETVLSCDFAYASNAARFALTEVTLGIMPGAGGTQVKFGGWFHTARFADTHARVGILPGWGLSQKLPRLIGMVLLKPGWQEDYEGRPPVYPIGCTGVITHADRLPDGRYNIVLRGVERFRIAAEEATRLVTPDHGRVVGEPWRGFTQRPVQGVEPAEQVASGFAHASA